MTGFKIKDLVKDKPSHIRNWENLKEMSLYTLKSLDDIKMRQIKGFDIKCKRMLDEATSNWISPEQHIDVLFREDQNEFGKYKDIEVFLNKQPVYNYLKFYCNDKEIITSIEDIAQDFREISPDITIKTLVSIINKLTD